MTATGSGSIDISNRAIDAQMVVAGGNLGVVQIAVRFVGDTLYEAPPGLSKLEGGPSWVSFANTPGANGPSSSALATTGNPTSFFQLPSQPGADIISLGPGTVDDKPVSAYSVIFSGSSLRRLATAAGVSVPEQALRSPLLVNLVENLAVDASGRLAEITQRVVIGEDSVSESLDLSDYGTPTRIPAPPPSSVITYQQYLQDTGNGRGLLI